MAILDNRNWAQKTWGILIRVGETGIYGILGITKEVKNFPAYQGGAGLSRHENPGAERVGLYFV